MITPFEIENKEFARSVRGYKAEEVDEFLDIIILDLQKLLVENEKMKENIQSLEADLAQYKKSETSVLNTLESAKKLMNDISESAEKRAEIIIRNAQMEAESIQKDARESVSKLTEEGEKLKGRVAKFRERYRQMLQEQLSQIEGSSEELFADLEREFDFVPASMDSTVKETSAPKPAVKTDTASLERNAVQEKPVCTPNIADTMVVSDKTLEEMLMENFGVGNSADTGKPMSREEMAKTRIVR